MKSLVKPVKAILLFPIFLYILLEDIIWDILDPIMGKLEQYKIIKRFEEWLPQQNRYVVFLFFFLISLCLTPFKLIGMYFIAQGHIVYGGSVFITAKVVGTALFVRLFKLGKEKLLQLWFFRYPYLGFVWVKTKIHKIFNCWKWYRLIRYKASRGYKYIKEKFKKTIKQIRGEKPSKIATYIKAIRRKIRMDR